MNKERGAPREILNAFTVDVEADSSEKRMLRGTGEWT